jgi:hypothetical protein
MRTLHEMAAAIDHALPLCEVVSNQPTDRDARRALTLALAPIADEAFVEPCERAAPPLRNLCHFVRIEAAIARDCLTRSNEPDETLQFIITNKARDLLALLPELKKAFARWGNQ